MKTTWQWRWRFLSGIQVYDKSRARYDRRQQTPAWNGTGPSQVQDQRMWVEWLTPRCGAPRIAAASDFLQEHIQHWS